VLGRHRQALARLGDLFKTGAIAKTYWAVVEGDPEADAGRIDVPLIRLDPQRGWWMKAADESPSADSLPSSTLWTVLGRSADRSLAWLELTPLTGRTHQLRVHCQASGWPIIGDPIYGSGPRFGGPGLHLHARAIRIPLHPNKLPISVEAPPPAHMQAALAICGWST
jgi:tRNA pseudouridine32 synthase/23S rRNA pseudouridine746 synthase